MWLLTSSDDSVTEVAEKKQRYANLVSSVNYQNARLLADTWCSVFVWQKDTSDLGKLCPTERDFRKIENNPHSILPHVKSEVRRLADQYQFFHWHLAFPDVFRLPEEGEAENESAGWNSGFDVVVGNPPWERIRLQEKEWFSTREPKIANAKNATTRRRLIAALQKEDPEFYQEFAEAKRQSVGESHILRDSRRYPHCGRGDVNTYMLFAETNRQMLSLYGRIGCIVPSGIATDDITKFFFQDLMHSRSLVSLFDFENARGIFQGVHRSYRFCLLTVTGLGIMNDDAAFVFFAHEVSQLSAPARRFVLTAQDIALLNPNSGTCPIFRSTTDAELTKHIFRRVPVMQIEGGCASNPWRVSMQRMIHMTDDADSFRSINDLVDSGYELCQSTFSGGGDTVFLPLYEAKMIHHFDHRWNGDSGLNSEACNEHASNAFATPRYYVPEELHIEHIPTSWNRRWFLGWRDITNTTNERSVISTVIPWAGIGNTIYELFPNDASSALCTCLQANLSAFALDYSARQKIGGTHLTHGHMKQLPVFPPETYDKSSGCYCNSSLSEWIFARVLELTYTAWDLEAFALDCNYDGPPFRWDEDRRFLIRCELDAAYFHLYLGSDEEWGADNPTLREMFPTPRDAVDYIMDTFPIVRRKDEAKHNGDYRTKRVILEIYDAMAQAIRTGQPYRTQLNPPPGPPADAEGNFIPFSQWTTDLDTSHIHPARMDRQRVEQGRLVLDLLLLLEAWRQPVSIAAIEPALLLMRNEAARKTLLTQVLKPREATDLRSEPQFISGLDRVYQAVEANGAIRHVGENGYELAKPEFLNNVSQADRDRAAEVIQAVARLSDLRTLPEVVAELTDERYEVTV